MVTCLGPRVRGGVGRRGPYVPQVIRGWGGQGGWVILFPIWGGDIPSNIFITEPKSPPNLVPSLRGLAQYLAEVDLGYRFNAVAAPGPPDPFVRSAVAEMS